MKKAFIVLLTATGTLFLAGCATAPNGGATTGNSQLGFVPVTQPEVLTKWAFDFPQIRSMETYLMTVPAGPEEPEDATARFGMDLEPGAEFVEPAAGDVETFEVIRHSPHPR